ncbi:MAG: hypothetical protein Q7U04_15115 [Bacteriovorax sp.]|nr:hypothetical protein [Bacteriovorax sp.]
MKKILLLTIAMASFQTFAFTSITLKSEAKLVPGRFVKSLYFSTSDERGSDYCTVTLTSKENADSLVVAAGTVFEVTSIDQNACGNDWGHVCRLDLSARNHEKNVNLSLICKNKGIFARELTESKVNKIAKNIISVQ